MTSQKIDFKKEIAAYKAAKNRFDIVTVPPMQYLMVDGHGDPNTSPNYTNALTTLYPIAYKLKFFSKRDLDRDYVVMPLEALWWADNMDAFTTARDKSQWQWTVMIMTPDWITQHHFETIINTLANTEPPPSLHLARLETLHEDRCVQTLHIGPYDDEAPILQRMHEDFIPTNGLGMTGKHHEIYLNDPRRTPPEKLRTILRQPVTTVRSTTH